MRWLIIEDSLESRSGHWFEYLKGFFRELRELGDDVTLLVSKLAQPFIQKELNAIPCLPESAFLKMSDRAPAWKRYARIPIHAWKTYCAIRKYFRNAPSPDLIFVPTVIVHHLLAWTALIKSGLIPRNSRLLLFFPGLPIRESGAGPVLSGSPTSQLMRLLLSLLKAEILEGKLIVGVETSAMKNAGEKVFGIPFTYLPHPVPPLPKLPETRSDTSQQTSTPILTLASYGPARHEKGSDLLVTAIAKTVCRSSEINVKFIVQWLDDFSLPNGTTSALPQELKSHQSVKIVSRYFEEGEYAHYLARTDVLLLPYRESSYGLRVSRVVIEAMVNGIPVVVTRGTTLAEQVEKFGAAVLCDDGNPDSLATAIEIAVKDYPRLKMLAVERKKAACEHFSVHLFRQSLLPDQRKVDLQSEIV